MTVDESGSLRETDDQAETAYRPGYEIVAEELLRYISEQSLQPGDRLPTEKGLAEILGASRTVTREAVKVLAAIGRVSVRKGAGIFVASSQGGLSDPGLVHYQPTDLEQVVMLLDFRRLVETETARRAATMATPIQVRAIREAAQESREAGVANQPDAFADADAKFHRAVAIAAQNDFLAAGVAQVRQYTAQSDVLLFHGDVPGSLEVAGDQHLEIADAIADGDMDRAMAAMTAHIDTTQHQFERRIRGRLFGLRDEK
jgi:DNA-binding FadR family transcriptional regulator